MIAKPEHSKLEKFSRALQIVVLLGIVLYFGQTLFVPASFGLLVSIVMYPICKWLEVRRWPRSLAIALCLSIVIFLFAVIIWLLSLEMSYLLHDIPAIIDKFGQSSGFQNTIAKSLGVPVSVQNEWLNSIGADIQGSLSGMIRGTLNATVSTLFMLFMIPVFAALYMYNREVFVKYLEALSGPRFKGRLHAILRQTTHTYFSFVKGTFMVYLIVGVLNSIGLYALGIEHALLYGMLTAFMTIIPYVGIIISALLPIATALLTKDSLWYPVGIIALFSFVQYLEGNIIFPKVVATQLNVSTWATLVAILIGTILWGVAGMILFIPFVAIFKIASDHIEELSTVNILLRR